MRPRFLMLTIPLLVWGQTAELQKARNLENSGRLQDAFQLYISLPDVEYLAARVARKQPREFLTLTEPMLESADPKVRTRIRLIRGDLMLLRGERTPALESYRQASAEYVDRPDYPIEPGPITKREGAMAYWNGAAVPLSGSHRDNWLIRRFVALAAWPDADREFERMWNLHRRRPATDSRFSRALQFALDYSFYLNKRARTDRALAVLEDQIQRLDLDRVKGYRSIPNQDADLDGAGITAGSFLSVAYGMIADAHREDHLVELLLNSPKHTMKRVHAWVLLRQGKTDLALAKELEYINEGGWNDVSKLIRRGAILDEFDRAAEAADTFRKALAMDFGYLNIPDAQWVAAEGKSRSWSWRSARNAERILRTGIAERLAHLAAQLGDQAGEAAALDCALQDEQRLADFEWLQRTSQRFRALGRTADFENLLRRQLPLLRSASTRVDVQWVLGDFASAAEEIALDTESASYAVDRWKERFLAKGTSQLRVLLENLVRQRTKDVISRVQLLAMAEPADSPWAIGEMEALLAPEMPGSYGGFKGPQNRTPFQSAFDVAYRLGRIYERSREFGKLRELALRVARGDAPFRYDDDAPTSHQLIALALQNAKLDELETHFAPALKARQWAPERAQLERRKNAARAGAAEGRDFGWSEELPDGARVLASNEDVLALASDEKYVYAGHPWGISVYDHKGRAVTRIAIGRPIQALAAAGQAVWAGTDKGLYRVAVPKFEVARVGSAYFDQPIPELASHEGALWIAGKNLGRLDLRNQELNLLVPGEGRFPGGHKTWRHFVFDGPYVWAHCDSGAYRFDTRTGSWAALRDAKTGDALELVGLIDGVLWAHTNARRTEVSRIRVGGSGHLAPIRPPDARKDSGLYQVDPATLATKQIPAFVPGGDSDPGWSYGGQYRENPVLGGYYFDRDAGYLRRVPDSREIEPAIPRNCPSVWKTRDNPYFCADFYLRLPDGSQVFGAHRNVEAGIGGVEFRTPAGDFHHASASISAPLSDVLPANDVRQAFTDPEGSVWIAGEGGVAVADRGFGVRGVFDTTNGLPANRITSGTFLNGRLCFAADSLKQGGLVVYDPQTRIFTTFGDFDGFPNRSVNRVEASDATHLRVYFSPGRKLGEPGDIRYPPIGIEPATGLLDRVRDDPPPSQPHIPGELPWLGGPILGEVSIHGKRVQYGTRGVVVFQKDAPALTFGAFSVSESAALRNRRLAEELRLPERTPDGLAPLLQHPNPFVRLKALDSIVQGPCCEAAWVQVLSSTPRDPFTPVRRLAVGVIASAALPEWKEFLTRGLSDPDQQVQGFSAYGLAKLGSPAPMSFYQPILRWPWEIWPPNMKPVLNVLAEHPTPEVIPLLLGHSRKLSDFWGNAISIGRAIVQSPESVDLALAWQDSRETQVCITFPQAVLAGAGVAIEPRLIAAISSTNAVVRSNAACALGMMGSRTAIPKLIDALILESGPSLRSVVWAMGELRAAEVAPRLADLYLALTASRSSASLQGNAYIAQMGGGINWAYEEIASVDALNASWDELAANETPEDASRRFGEGMVTTKQILTVLAKIGSPFAGEFFRRLIASEDPAARRELAVVLAEPGPGNIDLLRGLLADSDPETSSAAAVSLLLLGDDSGQMVLLERVKQCLGRRVEGPLARIADTKRLAFLKEALAACRAKAGAGYEHSWTVDQILGPGTR